MGYCCLFLVICLTWCFIIPGSYQLQSSQTQVLLQLKKHLEYPKQLDIWIDHNVDFCLLPSTMYVNVTCKDNVVTELRIVGDKQVKVNAFNGFAIPNLTLSETFSMDSFVTTLARITSLRVLSLVSLGIWGQLPDKIHRLSSLEYLDLSSNFLFGSVPPKFATMVKLQTLTLDDNFFNASVPNWFNSLSNLTILSLRSNEISGALPDLSVLSWLTVLDLSANKLDSGLPAMPKRLVQASLGKNFFSGEIPKPYTHLSSLQHLDLSFNALEGMPPAELFSLANISYLNLASNKLTGSLPIQFKCGSNLEFIDLSNNKLTGRLPSCLSSKSDQRVVKFGGNCLSTDTQHQHAESYCVEAHVKKSRGKNIGILAGVIAGLFVIIVLLACGFVIMCRRYCSRGISEQHLLHKSVKDDSVAGFPSELIRNARFISQSAKLGTQGLPACQTLSLDELKEATNNFEASALIGEGSCGKLYKGRLANGIQVAIRCLPSSKKYTFRNLKLRLDLLSRLRHPHLVCLLGHCLDDGGGYDCSVNKVFLVYEYLPHGNLRTHISGDGQGKVLNWSERLTVLTGVAKAVHFLHTGIIPGFFNNRLKTNNIFLNEHGMAKLSDYGLSIIMEEANDYGAKGEDLKSWQMTELVDDVYAFGFILLESLVGPSVSTKSEEFLLNELASCSSQDGHKRVLDPVVQATCSQESLSTVISLTNKCISSDSWSRPSFEDVLWNLQYAAQVHSTADGE